MTKSKVFLTLAVISQLFTGSSAFGMQAQSLSNYNFKVGAVLPVTHFNKQGKSVKYLVLGREAGGKDVGTYDDFSGSRDKGESHPVVTAAREFHEEGIMQDTLGMDLAKTRNRIDLSSKSNTTEVVLANENAVTYIVNFSDSEIRQFRKNFHPARAKQRSWKYQEKDRIATVRWDRLVTAIQSSKSNKGVTVQARLIDPATGNEEKNATTITLRPYLVKRLRPYITNQQCQFGKNNKIRFY